ncbi:DoxX family membrane protein [Rufibacter quisquiliarum]|uniref:Putative membrane protein YphA (DoxX/SURF4 family) n=1 Tax=Rufibacter quisquiliarum TaxID=1549639 RepID=A0A839GWJ0_9BACT|nr:DoxX family membrane protein [Rufibacter quisquiliarum]MBA9079815.1 putative membrane protein YphA (DoxX/SURF4 family) [Rufibacter quisquiliarum]
MALRNKDFLVLLIRLFLGYVFFSSGICKLTHGNFGQLIGPPWLEERLAQYGLGLFAQVVAVSQVVCGALLFSQRFSTLGAVMLVPMNLAILAVTISQNWTGTPYVNAVFLLLNGLLLAYEHQKFRFLFSAAPMSAPAATALDRYRAGFWPWAMLAAALVTLAVAPFNVQVLTNTAGLLTFALAGAAVLVPAGLSRLEKLMVAQAIGNMCLMTLGFVPMAIQGLLVNSGILLVLLLANPWLRARNKGKNLQTASLSA